MSVIVADGGVHCVKEIEYMGQDDKRNTVIQEELMTYVCVFRTIAIVYTPQKQ